MFVHLHTRSWFSFRAGGSCPADLVQHAARLGQPALALTDRHGIYGTVRFQKACRVAGVHAVLGAEIIADGKWRRAEIDLESLLKATYPQFKIFQIRELVLSPPWSSYTRCGIGGNGGGTQYWIDNFHIGPRE